MLLALDGHRDHAEILAFLLEDMSRLQADGDASLTQLPSNAEVESHLHDNLAMLAKLGLLHETDA